MKRRAVGTLADLTREQVETAQRVKGNGTEAVKVEALRSGDVVRVR